MPGAIFTLGLEPPRPGVYVRRVNIGEPIPVPAFQGIVAALFTADWGPLGSVVEIVNPQQVNDVFGTGAGTDIPREALRGGALKVKAYRLGTGGAKADIDLNDTTAVTPVAVVTLTAKYVGSRGTGFKVALADSLIDSTKRELKLYDGSTLIEVIPFTKGSPEPDAPVAA